MIVSMFLKCIKEIVMAFCGEKKVKKFTVEIPRE